jgi:organic radical activating enzyme
LSGPAYPVVAHFYTIQGEGAWTGQAAYFIRLAGCDVGCSWCDTRESWRLDGHPIVTVDELAASAAESGSPVAVVTGGEPTLHDLGPLTSALSEVGLRRHLETSGAHALTGEFDWVVLSPKKFKPPVESMFERADELKIVVVNKSDFEWAERYRRLCRPDVKLMLQPEWDSPHVLTSIVEYVKSNPVWTISLQTHKYLHIP